MTAFRIMEESKLGDGSGENGPKLVGLGVIDFDAWY